VTGRNIQVYNNIAMNNFSQAGPWPFKKADRFTYPQPSGVGVQPDRLSGGRVVTDDDLVFVALLLGAEAIADQRE